MTTSVGGASATEHSTHACCPATQLGLGNTADFISHAEAKAVNQARLNNIATYNEYRVAMGLAPAASFEEVVGETQDSAESARRKKLVGELRRLTAT